MSGMTSTNSAVLRRSEIWSSELKKVLEDSLEAQKYVRWISEFSDGDQFTVPSIGALEARDYQEDTAIQYDALDTGEFNFTITEYVSSATYITKKNRQDLFYASELEASFIPSMSRAIMEDLETHILKEGQPRTGNPAGYQVAGNANQINGADHRWVGLDTANSNRVVGTKDFAKAKYALQKANVPLTDLVAIVDPAVAYHLETLTGIADMTYNPKWEGIVTTGLTTGMRFIRNIYGFDVYESNYLPLCGADAGGTSETINTVASGANAVCNIFFSMSPDVVPFIGAWRQMPEVDGEYNKDFQREEYVTTARYGTKIYRPENFVTVLSSTDVIV